MALEQTKNLLRAIYENAELIDMLTDVITDPVYFVKANQDKSLSLLKGAGLIEELDDDYYMPGERFDALQQIIDTSNYSLTVSPDISTWLKDFRQSCYNYKMLSEQELLDESVNSLSALRQVGRLSARITNSFKVEIREIDADIGNNLNRFPRHEDKIRQSQYYLDKLSEIQNEKLTRLTFKDLNKLSQTDETDKIVLFTDRKLYDLREYLIRVLNRVSDFNFRARELSKRKQRLSLLFNRLSSGELELNEDDLNERQVVKWAILPKELYIKAAPHLAATELTAVEEAVLNDLIARANLAPMFDDIEIEQIDKTSFMEERPAVDTISLVDSNEKRFTKITDGLLRKIVTNKNQPVSIMEHWLSGDFKDISPNAWLCVMGDRLFEVQGSFKRSDHDFIISGVKRKRSEWTQIRILSDLVVEIKER